MEINNGLREMTEKQFQAWCEWKKWCSIWRVRDPQPTAEDLENNLEDDLEADLREEHCQYLTEIVCRCMHKKVSAWHRRYTGKKMPSDVMAESLKSLRDEYVSAFDSWMKSEKKKSENSFPYNSYKDYLFYRLTQSDDHYGKVIMGKIFSTKGYMNAIIKKYLEETELLAKGPRNGTINVPLDKVSLTERPETEEGTTLAPSETIGSEDENILADKAAVKEFYDSMTHEDKIIYAAIAYHAAPSNEQLLAQLHCRKEHSYTLFSNLIKRLSEYVTVNDKHFLKELLFYVMTDLEPEKELHSFLLSIGAISDEQEGGKNDL